MNFKAVHFRLLIHIKIDRSIALNVTMLTRFHRFALRNLRRFHETEDRRWFTTIEPTNGPSNIEMNQHTMPQGDLSISPFKCTI